MIAFDTDVLTEILLGNRDYVSRVLAIPESEQTVPIIVIEEIMRGRLNVIRQAEEGKSKISIDYAYELFGERSATFEEFKSSHTHLRLNYSMNNGDSKKSV